VQNGQQNAKASVQSDLELRAKKYDRAERAQAILSILTAIVSPLLLLNAENEAMAARDQFAAFRDEQSQMVQLNTQAAVSDIAMAIWEGAFEQPQYERARRLCHLTEQAYQKYAGRSISFCSTYVEYLGWSALVSYLAGEPDDRILDLCNRAESLKFSAYPTGSPYSPFLSNFLAFCNDPMRLDSLLQDVNRITSDTLDSLGPPTTHWSIFEDPELIIKDQTAGGYHSALRVIAMFQRESMPFDSLKLLINKTIGSDLTAAQQNHIHGMYMLCMQRPIEAREAFLRAIRLDPAWPEPVFGLAESYLQFRNPFVALHLMDIACRMRDGADQLLQRERDQVVESLEIDIARELAVTPARLAAGGGL
jgi:hypothetical protein